MDGTDRSFTSNMSSVTSLSNDPLTPTTWDFLTLDEDEDEDQSWPTNQDVAEMALMLYNQPTPLSWDRRSLRRLVRSAFPIKLIGEGAANAVFELGFPSGCPAAFTFKGWLLRVAKAPINGDPPRYNYLNQQEFYARRVRTLLRDHVVQQELVILRGSNIVRKLNNFLSSVDHERKAKFRGSFVADTNWGFLVEDMRPRNPSDTLLIEFKPKWLAQSPSAPTEAIRCRQCAMELCNYINNPSPTKSLPVAKPCPLTLGNKHARSEVADPFRIAPELKHHPRFKNDPYIVNALERVIDHKVIHDLRAAQVFADRDGPLSASRGDRLFQLAMTIRDCTCFVQIPLNPLGYEPLRLRLGDFDLKDAASKFDHWQAQERELRPYYTADWILSDQTFYHPPTACLLEWHPRRQPNPAILMIRTTQDTDASDRDTVVESPLNVSTLTFQPADEAKLSAGLRPFRKDAAKPNDLCPFRLDPGLSTPRVLRTRTTSTGTVRLRSPSRVQQ